MTVWIILFETLPKCQKIDLFTKSAIFLLGALSPLHFLSVLKPSTFPVPLISVTHFSASVCCSLIPTLNRTGCTRSSIPFWISRGSVSNIAPGIGTLTLKPFLFPVITGSMSGAKPEVAWVTLKVTFLRSITPTLISSNMASSSPLRNKESSEKIKTKNTDIINSTKDVMILVLYVCVFVFGYVKNCWTDFSKMWWKVRPCAKEGTLQGGSILKRYNFHLSLNVLSPNLQQI